MRQTALLFREPTMEQHTVVFDSAHMIIEAGVETSMVTRKQILAYVLKQYGIAPDFPWDSAAHAVLRHKANRKWFGVIMEITEGDLGLNSHKVVDVINLKCDAVMIGGLRKEPGIYPAYHMNKNHWVSVLLNSPIPKEKVFALIAMSYDLTKPRKCRF